MIATLHANGAREGLAALVSTAVMAAANVQVNQVRDVFSQTVDVVVHVGREAQPGGGIRRQVVEIVAVPAMQGHDTEFTVEPIFARERPDAPLRWTGAPLPAALETRLDRALRADSTSVRQILELGRCCICSPHSRPASPSIWQRRRRSVSARVCSAVRVRRLRCADGLRPGSRRPV